MAEFYQGTSDTVVERLCKSISGFDKLWFEKCVPAAEEQIQQLDNICNQYGYKIPKVYLDYLRAMGENDGGLLEREWDENCYLRVGRLEDNPVVTGRDNQYFAGSFEKYLFQKAFRIYQDKFQYNSPVGTSVNSFDAVLKKYSFPCSVHGGTTEERMKFVMWLTEPFHMKGTWFGDALHYFSYDGWYALEINIRHSLWLVFSCDDPMLKKKADFKLGQIFNSL